jgi:hypothetical protein
MTTAAFSQIGEILQCPQRGEIRAVLMSGLVESGRPVQRIWRTTQLYRLTYVKPHPPESFAMLKKQPHERTTNGGEASDELRAGIKKCQKLVSDCRKVLASALKAPTP